MAIEMTSDEVIDLLLRHGVQVLELVHRRELGHVETVGRDAVYPHKQTNQDAELYAKLSYRQELRTHPACA